MKIIAIIAFSILSVSSISSKPMELFVYPGCPYCTKVIASLDQLNYKKGVDINIINARIQENNERLLKLGGKKQTPFLIDYDTKIGMYESENIIKYLTNKKV